MRELIKIIQRLKLIKVLLKVQLNCFTTIVKFTSTSFFFEYKNINIFINRLTFGYLELIMNFNKNLCQNKIQEKTNKSVYLMMLFTKISDVIEGQKSFNPANEIEYISMKNFELVFGLEKNSEYFKIFTMFLFILLISFVLFGVAYFLSLSTIKDSEKLSQYECGFEPFDEATRHPFDIHFYVVGILFLIFDVEIALLFPWVLGLQTTGWLGFISMFLFLFILAIGFFYEWHRGALVWPHEDFNRKVEQELSNNTDKLYFNSSKSSNVTFMAIILLYPNFDEVNWDVVSVSINDFVFVLPEVYVIIMVLVALILVGMSNFAPRSTEVEKKINVAPVLYCLIITTMCIASLLCLWQCYIVLGKSTLIFQSYAITDMYTQVIKVIILLTTIIILISTEDSLKKHPRHLMEYPILKLLTTLFLMILISAYNFITVFLAIIGFSINLYVLLLNDSFNQSSREAGIKYFYLSSISSGLLICGIFFLYLIFQSTSFMLISWLIHNWIMFDNLEVNSFLISVMLYFIIFGFLFKLAAFPCHLWAPEVYDGSPNAITAMFVLPIKVATFALFLRVLGQTFGDLYEYWHYILWMSSFFSMVWGCLGAFIEQNIKRFVAYSSINQMGFLLMGLTSGTFEGYRSALIYLLLYVIMNIGFFVLFLATREIQSNKPLTYLTDFNSFAQENSLYSIGLVIILFSMAGIPPLGGFFGKYFIFLHSFETGHLFLVVIGMLTSMIATYYYLRIIKIMWFEKSKNNGFVFKTSLDTILLNVYFFIEYILIWFLIWSPWLFAVMNVITRVSIHPLC
jgi:NADH-quinone oxidoreductase subunit N